MHVFGLCGGLDIRGRVGGVAVHNLLGYGYVEEAGLLADGLDVVTAEVVRVRGVQDVGAYHDTGGLELV